jgi:TolA-binding protein
MWPLLLLLMDMSATHQAALDAYKHHKFQDAVTQFSEALKTEDPASVEYGESVLLLGQSFYLQSKYAEAVPWLEKATAAKGATPEAAYMLGNACILTQQSNKAVRAFAQLFGVEKRDRDQPDIRDGPLPAR